MAIIRFRHLEKAGLTYSQHIKAAWGYARRAGAASVTFFVHGLWPDAFQYKGSQIITGLKKDLHAMPAKPKT
jgi:hypothetical protein